MREFEKEFKFYPHGMGKNQQMMTFETVKDHIVDYVQKTYKHGHDMALSLRDDTEE